MKVLLTGATGFVGKNLIPKLLNDHEIFEITIEPEISKAIYGGNVESFHFNGSQEKLIEFISDVKADSVVHLASFLTSSDEFSDVERLFDANLKFLLNILDAIKAYPPKIFINTGTFAEYFNGDENFNPAYIYAATKTASRSILNYYSGAYNFRFINVVPYSIYGPNDSQMKIMDLLIESAKIPLDFTNGEQVLDFIHVDDVANAYVKILEKINFVNNNETFYAGTGKGTSIRELATLIEKTIGRKLNINWGAKPYRKRDVMKAIAPIFKNNNLIKWKSEIDLDLGLRKKILVNN